MAYTLIKGTFVIFYPNTAPSGQPKPDGDTIKFIPDQPDLLGTLTRVPGICIDLGADWKISVRFEGIDALELHFGASGGDYRQELGLAVQARDRMLDLLQFGNPQFVQANPNDCPITDKSVFAAIDPPPHAQANGYILARDVDVNGRVIAFVFPGDPPQPDGSSITVDAAMVATSINATLLSEGLAYPTLYSSMPPDLRPVFANLTQQARAGNLGVWASATMTPDPNSAVMLNDVCSLQPLVIWPKLFRRLVSFFTTGNNDLNQFDAWLRAEPKDRDDRMLLPNGDFGNMHDMVEVTAAGIHTVFQPEDVVIEPDDPVTTLELIRPRFPRRDIRILAALVNPVDKDDAGKEIITLLNALPFRMDLTGWQLATVNQQGTERKQDLNGTFDPGAVLQVVWQTGALSNSGSELRLLNPKGALVDRVRYTESQAGCVGQTIVF
jgi:endonuclease YncB( thermonuclease family)